MTDVAPFGTWKSPITAQTVAAQGLRLGFPALDGDDIYWLEGRPQEGGRNVLVKRSLDGAITDVTPRDHNVRTRVHEYGGGAYVVSKSFIYYSNFADQRLYRIIGSGTPQPITPEGKWFYADATIDEHRQRLICVREDHSRDGHEPRTTLVSIRVDGDSDPGEVIADGYDFYSTPRLSLDGTRLAWLSWRHPQMPWDGTELWVARVTGAGTLEEPELIAGGPHESIFQPGWGPDGLLYFASDRTGWWSLYRSDVASVAPTVRPLLWQSLEEAEFGRPQWLFGWATWAFADDRHMAVTYARRGRWSLATIDLETGTLTDVPTDLEPLEWLAATPTHAVYVAASPDTPSTVAKTNLATGGTEMIRSSSTLELNRRHISVPEAIEFPTEGGLTAHAFYYPPRNADYMALPSDRPPLIVISHGGPTTQTKAVLDLGVQYWTNRGFAVVDVNYGGSSGYGREYRERLNWQWGIVDVDDNINAARYLVEEGKADPDRLIIRGGSAGGYTTLAALAFHPDVFAAGASYYGVSDVEALAKDTHKFESRYLDTMIGPYPEMKDLYRERSPIHFIERLSCALILFQGLEDKVVPPDQSERMAEAVRGKGLPIAYIAFEGEQHGFRKADTIIRCLEAELYFYGAIFRFTPADTLPLIYIENLR
ncbi:MAG TPA: S9 family peptidase [Vicinamibacterales bacterium]|nr:S9 family peptidase [Vicinamibacterales bacterium]